MRLRLAVTVLLLAHPVVAQDCGAPPEKGGSVLLYVEGKDSSGRPYKNRQCVRREGERREVRTLAPSGGYLDLTVWEGRTTVQTWYDRHVPPKIVEYSIDLVAIEKIAPGRTLVHVMKIVSGKRVVKWTQTSRARGTRVVQVGACKLDVVDFEHTNVGNGWTQQGSAVFAPAVGYAIALDYGPWVDRGAVNTSSRGDWRVVRIGDRDEARRLCDDFTS